MRYSRAWPIAVVCALYGCQRASAPAVLPPSTTQPATICIAPPAAVTSSASTVTPPPQASSPAAEAPHPSPRAPDDPFAHRLQEFYEGQKKPRETSACNTEQPRTKVSEISIELTGCLGGCEVYSLTLHADGSVDYYGEAYIDPIGMHHGVIDVSYFDQMARLAEDIGWFSLENNYSCHVTDHPITYTSLVRNDVRKTIRHYDPLESGPPRLYFFERTLADYMRYVEWTD